MDVTSPLLQRPGAVPADAPDEGVAGHYGDPYREQRSLAAGFDAHLVKPVDVGALLRLLANA